MIIVATQTEMNQLAELLLKKYLALHSTGRDHDCCCGKDHSSSAVPTQVKSPIRITSADFISATEWAGKNSDQVTVLPSYELEIYADDINQRYLHKNVDWVRTASGFKINAAWFDATVNSYVLYVLISNPSIT